MSMASSCAPVIPTAWSTANSLWRERMEVIMALTKFRTPTMPIMAHRRPPRMAKVLWNWRK